MISVEIIERSPIYAEGLIRILERNELRVLPCGSVWTGSSSSAEVLIVDSAIWPASEAESAGAYPPVLLTVADLDETAAQRYLRAGAQGVLDRCADPRMLVEAVRTVAGGRSFAGAAPAGLEPVAGEPSPATKELSHREHQVIQLIARGMTHGQIARRLGLSPHTVDTYIRRVRAKLELGNKADLTRAALMHTSDVRELSRQPRQGVILQ